MNKYMDEVTPILGVPDPNPQMVSNTRSDVLAKAYDLVNGERQEDYGTPEENMSRIATMFNILFPEREWSASDIPLAMMAVKFGRSCQGYTRDTAVDMAGYASLWAEIAEVEKK